MRMRLGGLLAALILLASAAAFFDLLPGAKTLHEPGTSEARPTAAGPPPSTGTPEIGDGSGGEALSPTSVAKSEEPDSIGTILTLAVVLASSTLALAITLVLFLKRWRFTFQGQGLLVLPSAEGDKLLSGIHLVARALGQHDQSLSKFGSSIGSSYNELTKGYRVLHEEFSILRGQLDEKDKEIRRLRLGYESHVKKNLLSQIVNLVRILDQDTAHFSPASPGASTIAALRGVLEDILKQSGVHRFEPAVGERVTALNNRVDLQSARRVSTESPDKRGTVAGIDAPGYVIAAPDGTEELLVPAKVAFFA